MHSHVRFNRGLVRQYHKWMKAMHYAGTTQTTYLKALHQYVGFMGQRSLARAKHTDVRLFIAHASPKYHDATFTDLTTNAAVVIGAQAAAYPVVLLFIFFLVRTRSRQRFAEAIQWNWPGMLAPGFVIGGVVLALVVEGLARHDGVRVADSEVAEYTLGLQIASELTFKQNPGRRIDD